jgi:TPR repeat protein
LLAEERVRNQVLEQQPSIRQNDQKLLTPEAPGGLEAARLMEQAHLLLDQGNITAARSVLERAAESGSTLALFLLAETYDPAILSAWGIFSVWGIFGRRGGRRGNVTKARKLYAKAVAGGVHEAKYRLTALRTPSYRATAPA